MRYRVEVLIYWAPDAQHRAAQYEFVEEYTDNRDVANIKAQWLSLFMSFYGLVVDTETGNIEYSIGAVNPDWVKDVLRNWFKSLPNS